MTHYTFSKHCKSKIIDNPKITLNGILGLTIRDKSDLDESPSAYKDIESVMENQKDLVEIVRELTPLAVIKG